MFSSPSCEIRIIPDKEKNRTEIKISHHNFPGENHHNVITELKSRFNNIDILETPDQEIENASGEINFKIPYPDLETILKDVEQMLVMEFKFSILKRSVFIKKLDGWFDC